MSYPVVPNTFQNSTTADATQVNANFTALVNGITDGSKDLNAYKITANGTLVAANTLSASTAQIGTVIASGLSANTGYFAVGIMGSALASALSANSVFANNLTVNNSFESNVTVSALSAYSINVNNLTVSTLTPSNIVTSSLSANSLFANNLSTKGLYFGSGTTMAYYSIASGTVSFTGVSTAPSFCSWNATTLGNGIVTYQVGPISSVICTGAAGIGMVLNSLPAWASYLYTTRDFIYAGDPDGNYHKGFLNGIGGNTSMVIGLLKYTSDTLGQFASNASMHFYNTTVFSV